MAAGNRAGLLGCHSATFRGP